MEPKKKKKAQWKCVDDNWQDRMKAETCHKDRAQMDPQKKRKRKEQKRRKGLSAEISHESLDTIGFGAKHSSAESAMSS